MEKTKVGKSVYHLLSFLIIFSLSVNGNSLKNKKQPNILLLYADDLGWTDISSGKTNLGNGSKYYQTPNLDQLAETGMSFSSMHMCQNCAPSRAALLSGQYAPRTGIYNVGSLDRGDKNSVIKPIEQANHFSTEMTTLAETLQKAGYITAHFGKWGLPGGRGQIEESHGFDISYSTSKTTIREKIETGYYPKKDENGNLQFSMYGDMVGSLTSKFTQPYTADYIREFLVPYVNDNDPQELIGTAKHLTDAMADATADFLKEERIKLGAGKPFFMYVAFNQVHVPIEPRSDLLAKYEQIASKDSRHTNIKYAAFIEHLDQVCARMIDQLKDPNGDGESTDDLSSNTIIIFTSDNGGAINNLPLNGKKGMQKEGGTRVPLIVHWPGKIKAGQTSSLPLHVVDLYPTIADLADVELPEKEEHILDGESFAPVLIGRTKELKRQAVFGHFPGYMDTRSVPTTFIIREFGRDQYKMLYYYESQVYELFQISEDIVELNNLLEGQPSKSVLSIAGMLRKDMLKWLNEMEPQPMTYRSSGEFVPLPVPLNKN